jgi:hypothetical protein
MPNSFAIPRRWGRAALLVASMTALLLAVCGSLTPVAADDAYFGPQLTVDHNVAERGVTVTVTLNGFPAGQNLRVYLRTPATADQGPDAVSVPVSTDANGAGAANISTAGLAPDTYIVGVASASDSAPLVYQATVFGVTDPGILGPRAVRYFPSSSDDSDG